MHLRQIELHGYKSFANRTDFVFNGGITAIVGPNGSGKSNIADAVRWVLGEKRQKALRARKTEDLIFAGTDRRGQVGMAQVSMILDNSTHWLPIDFGEVTITRRAYRSGENEYLLNGTRVRRQDIIHLLGQGGLSSNTYTVIGQGMVDAALSLQPAQRRSLFENAAGLAVYQAKRDEALRKLAKTEENIQRAQDIIHEITPRLERLKRQAARADEYVQLDEQLHERLHIWYGYRRRQAHTTITQSEMALREARATEGAARNALASAEKQLAELRTAQTTRRKKLETDREEQAHLRETLEKHNRDLSVMKERHRLATQRKKELSSEITSLRDDLQARQERIAELEQELATLTERTEAQKNLLSERKAHLAEGEKRAKSLQKSISQLRRERAQLVARLTRTDRDLAQILARRKEVEQDRLQHQKAVRTREEQVTGLAEQMTALRSEVAGIAKKISAISSQQADKEAALQAASRKHQKMEKQWQETISALRALQGRYDLLDRLRREGAGFESGAQALLQAAERGRLKGFIAPVARLFRVPEPIQTAIQAALHEQSQAIVFDTWENAEKALLWLQRANVGRAQILSADRLPRPRKIVPPKEAAGLLGIAADLVEHSAKYADLVRTLLGSVLIVEDWNVARRYWQANDLTVVTIAGEILGPGGRLVAGVGKKSTTDVLAIEREWYPLGGQISAAEEKRDTLQQKKDEAARREQQLSAQAQSLARQIAALEQELKPRRKALEKAERKRDRVTQEVTWYQELTEKAQAEQERLAQKQKSANRLLVQLRSEQRALQQRMAVLEGHLAHTHIEDARQNVAQARTDLALLGEQVQTHHTLLRDQRQSLERMARHLASRKEKNTQLQNETVSLQESIAAREQTVMESHTTLQSLARRMKPALSGLRDLEEEQIALEEKVSSARERLLACQESTHQAELAYTQDKDALQHLNKRISQELGLVEPEETPAGQPHQSLLPLDSVATSLPSISVLPEGLEKDIQRLRRRIGRMGAVNPDAPKEYEELRTRHDFLQTQSQDLSQAASGLRQISADLDEVMREKFRTTFDAIAQAFARYFTRLFDGGEASLVLTDPDNLTDTGIDILARVPGKRRQPISLLSGGERSLTAAALIFSLLEVSPTPFCLLDEVDAMLDESNIGRFRDTLLELSHSSQFIVITHNRGTVEAAQTIYGISLGDTGASQVISLKLDEAVALTK